MKIDILGQPDPDIFRDRKKYALWFIFFLSGAFVAIAIGVYAVYFATQTNQRLEDWALAILAGSALGINWPGSRLQKYKKLFPPQRDNLVLLRSQYPAIEEYCRQVDVLGRRLIRAEYEACVAFSEKHSAIPFVSDTRGDDS